MIKNVAASAKKQKECVRVVTGEAMVLGMGTSLVQATKAQKPGAHAAHVDVAKREFVEKLVANTTSEYGRLDYMFNNAAATATRGELRGLTLEPWYRAIDVNLLGVVYGTIAAYSVMARQGFGHIVNTASLAGLIGFPTSIPYGATKSAVIGLSVSLRIEAAGLGVKVSVACPGPVHSTEQQRFRLIGIERAAQLILRGVERDQAIIVFPLSARLLWWMYRLSPRLLFPIGRKVVRDFRAEHGPPTAPGRPTKSPLTARGAEMIAGFLRISTAGPRGRCDHPRAGRRGRRSPSFWRVPTQQTVETVPSLTQQPTTRLKPRCERKSKRKMNQDLNTGCLASTGGECYHRPTTQIVETLRVNSCFRVASAGIYDA